MSPLAFVLAALAVLVMPGPTNLLLVASGERLGPVRGLALVPLVLLAYWTGIGAVSAVIALAPMLPLAPVLKSTGALWLAWLALRIWRNPELARRRAGGPLPLFLTTLTNPKVMVFATLLIPPAPLLPRLLLVTPPIIAVSLLYLMIGAGLVRIGVSQRVLWRSLAALLLGFAGVALAA